MRIFAYLLQKFLKNAIFYAKFHYFYAILI